MCGEKTAATINELRQAGSPPRVRGKEFERFLDALRPGITPACAGKREGPKNAQSKIGDHPRVCGEKIGDLLRTLLR